MAWIAIRHELEDDPAVIAIAADLSLDVDSVLGKLFRFWSWADRQSSRGRANGVTAEWIDAQFGALGFAKSLQKVGWLIVTETGIRVPRFERWMSQGAKTRALAARRQQRKRSRDASRSKRDLDNRTNRTEQKTEKKKKKQSAPPVPEHANRNGNPARIEAAALLLLFRGRSPSVPPLAVLTAQFLDGGRSVANTLCAAPLRFSEGQAARCIKRHGLDEARLRDVLEWALAEEWAGRLKNPGGWVNRALESAWPEPPKSVAAFRKAWQAQVRVVEGAK